MKSRIQALVMLVVVALAFSNATAVPTRQFQGSGSNANNQSGCSAYQSRLNSAEQCLRAPPDRRADEIDFDAREETMKTRIQKIMILCSVALAFSSATAVPSRRVQGPGSNTQQSFPKRSLPLQVAPQVGGSIPPCPTVSARVDELGCHEKICTLKCTVTLWRLS